MIIALIGADGQLGSDLARRIPPASLRPLLYPAFDVTRPESADVLRGLGADVVINTSAFHRVDECEARVEEAFRVNAFAVRALARVCAETGSVLVHFSTDFVFDGAQRRPYKETDAPGPQSAYAASKLAGEYFVRAGLERHYVVRTCGLFGTAGCLEKGRNFVETMLWLAERGQPIRVVNDQVLAPTSTAELADNVLALVETGAYGLYHMTSRGSCSWFEFAAAIFELSGARVELIPTTTAAFGSPARRPAYSVLDNGKAGALGLPGFSTWREALAAYLKAKKP